MTLADQTSTLITMTDTAKLEQESKVNDFLDILDSANTEMLQDDEYLNNVLVQQVASAIDSESLVATERQEPTVVLSDVCDQDAQTAFVIASSALAS